VRHEDAAMLLNKLAGQVDRGAVAAGRHVQLAGIGLGVADEVGRVWMLRAAAFSALTTITLGTPPPA
jgi:hypothetical protein